MSEVIKNDRDVDNPARESLSFLGKRWVVKETPDDQVRLICKKSGVKDPIARLLINRGIDTHQQVNNFLKTDLSAVHDPFLMKGMSDAVTRVVQAILAKEKITVFGDYDVDGVTSAAFMIFFLKELNVSFEYYLPERKEGYGLNNDALNQIKAKGSTLVITADCGITAVKEVEHAKKIGVDVIITDHHQVGAEGLPDAVSVLNAHQPGCEYPYRFLSGVGTVFKLASGIRRGLFEAGWKKDRLPNLKKHLDLLALGTVADLAPLTGENHLLVRHGLEVLRVSQKQGLAAMKKVAGLDGRIDAFSIGFVLGPRLNAAGRMGRADKGLHLLTSESEKEAEGLAHELEAVNKDRKEAQQWTLEEAEYLISRDSNHKQAKVLVLASDNFHPGVIGVVASKLVDKYYRPTILIATKEGSGKGSARSIPHFNLHKAMTQCSEHMTQFGGHAYAAGLSIESAQVSAFRDAMNAVGEKYLNADNLTPKIHVDMAIDLDLISWEFYRELQTLAPFGQMNPEPVFMSTGVQFAELRPIGKEKNHCRFKITQGKKMIEGVGFQMVPVLKQAEIGPLYDIVYTVQDNDFLGRSKLEIRLLDCARHRAGVYG